MITNTQPLRTSTYITKVYLNSLSYAAHKLHLNKLKYVPLTTNVAKANNTVIIQTANNTIKNRTKTFHFLLFVDLGPSTNHLIFF